MTKRFGTPAAPPAPDIDIVSALRDPQLLGAALGDPSTRATWFAALRASEGLPLDKRQRQIFNSIAGGRKPPRRRPREVIVSAGRNAGKSQMAGGIGVHAALLQQHKLAKGETGHVLILSPTLAQAKTVFGYALAFCESSPVLRREIIATTATEIRLRNNIVISMHPASFRSVRGRTLLACIFDEAAFWRDETSANPDIEAYRAVLPSLIRTHGQLVCISTPYRKAGLLYTKHRDHFAQDDDDVLVVQGASQLFNPTLNSKDIVKAMAEDPEAAPSEWEATFRSDLAAFLDENDIDACVNPDRPSELPPIGGIKYTAFCDPSGGRHDAMTLCIAHKDGEQIIVDVIRGRAAPFDPRTVTEEFASLLKDYRITEVFGDNFAAAWVESAFKDVGMRYKRSIFPKGRLYIEGLPAFTRQQVSFPEHPRLLRELRLLQRATHRSGRDTVDHQRNDHDDYANSLFGAIYHAQRRVGRMLYSTYNAGGYDNNVNHPTYEVTADGLVEVNRPGTQRHVHIVRNTAGELRLRGGDNGAWPGRAT